MWGNEIEYPVCIKEPARKFAAFSLTFRAQLDQAAISSDIMNDHTSHQVIMENFMMLGKLIIRSFQDKTESPIKRTRSPSEAQPSGRCAL
jgi:hypothetical protein